MARFEFGLSRFEGIEVQEFESVFRNFVLKTYAREQFLVLFVNGWNYRHVQGVYRVCKGPTCPMWLVL